MEVLCARRLCLQPLLGGVVLGEASFPQSGTLLAPVVNIDGILLVLRPCQRRRVEPFQGFPCH